MSLLVAPFALWFGGCALLLARDVVNHRHQQRHADLLNTQLARIRMGEEPQRVVTHPRHLRCIHPVDYRPGYSRLEPPA